MTLIESIINELVDPSIPLAGPLLKTKLLASRLDNSALLNWVNGELNGLSKIEDAPTYRISTGDLKGNVINGNMSIKHYTLPVDHLTPKQFDSIRAVYILDSIDALEDFAKRPDIRLKISVSSKVKDGLEYSIQNLGNPYFQILSVYKEISASLFKNILSSVRSKLLDFMIAMEKEFGEETTIEALRKNNKIINNFMSTTIYNNGDGNVNNVGDKANVAATITIQKNNKDLLNDELKNSGLDQASINELLSIVDSESVNAHNSFGKEVSTWIHKMIGKAVDGSWQISVGAAGGVLAEAINHYYGL